MFIQIKDWFIWHTYDSTHKQYPIFELYQEIRPLYGTIPFENIMKWRNVLIYTKCMTIKNGVSTIVTGLSLMETNHTLLYVKGL